MTRRTKMVAKGDIFEIVSVSDEVDSWDLTKADRSMLVPGHQYLAVDLIEGDGIYEAYDWIDYVEVPRGTRALVEGTSLRKATIECTRSFGGTFPKGVELRKVGEMRAIIAPVVWVMA